MMQNEFNVGDHCWLARQATPCQIIEHNDVWGERTYRVWLPVKDAVIRVNKNELSSIGNVKTSVEQILHVVASAKLLDALEDNLLLSPIQSNVVPLPHQLYALNRAISRDRIRYLLADEVGLGKTIEAGLILRELKLRGKAKRILVVTPKGLVRQWQAEMHLHFNEKLHFIDPSEMATFRQWHHDKDNLWQVHDQVICSLDSVKPLDSRRGWSLEQLNNYNRERFEDLISASWDLVIIDEAHRMGGSTERVARYKLGAALAEASPYILLLSATPHQGKTDQFLRLMQLLDRDTFPDEQSVNQNRVRPFVIRTEKRESIDADGQPLFKPRITRLQTVTWQSCHKSQRQLYEAVTNYVRHGYNQAMLTKQRYIGFLMILMQRLVTSSTSAIRTTLEKRLALLNEPQLQTSLSVFENTSEEDWSDLDGQSQVDLAMRVSGWEIEKSEVEMLLNLARKTEASGTDAKAEALLDLIYKLQQEENEPQLKVLIFTEFVPTQSMLAEYLETRGFSVVKLNGSMDIDARIRTQKAFSQDIRVLISTDAGGEGLNLQFCHIIINFDMPWNPMRLEQRIGRVDRIGQHHVVRAINFVLEDTVEHRVRQVLEEKLELIAKEFGVDKVSDVMDSAETELLFDELFVNGLQNLDTIEQDCNSLVLQLKETLTETKRNCQLLSDTHELEAGDAKKWRDHPAQYWLELAITNSLNSYGGSATKIGHNWEIQWTTRSELIQVCFDAKTAEKNSQIEWVTLDNPKAYALISELPRFNVGQPLPVLQITGLPESIRGIWSLWEINLVAENESNRRFLPIFINEDGRSFIPTAKRIWDLLLTETINVFASSNLNDAKKWFELSEDAAKIQGSKIFSKLLDVHRIQLQDKRERANYAFEARQQAIGRIGLPSVREYRLKNLQQEHNLKLATLAESEICVPDLNAVMILYISASNTIT